MADASKTEVDFSAEGVRSFIIKHGGKVSNVAVVGHFMAYLRHPDKEVRGRDLCVAKSINRQRERDSRKFETETNLVWAKALHSVN